jgi:hypothetical protein
LKCHNLKPTKKSINEEKGLDFEPQFINFPF